MITGTTEIPVPAELRKFADHLEFLGYKNNMIPPTSEVDVYAPVLATPPHGFMVVYFCVAEMTKFSIVFKVRPDLSNRENAELLEALNQWNRECVLLKFFLHPPRQPEPFPSLWCTAAYPGDYERGRFGVFFSLLISEMNQRASFETLAPFMAR